MSGAVNLVEVRHHMRACPDHEVTILRDDQWHCLTCEDNDDIDNDTDDIDVSFVDIDGDEAACRVAGTGDARPDFESDR